MAAAAAAVELPPLTPNLECLKLHLKFATKFDAHEPEIAFWFRVYAYQRGLYKLSADGTIREENEFMAALYDLLAKTREESDNELIKHDKAAENYFKQLVLENFDAAEEQDNSGVFNEELVRTFFSASMFADVLGVFHEGLRVPESFNQIRVYAKWKTCQIHTSLKNGNTLELSGIPKNIAARLGLIDYDESDEDENNEEETSNASSSNSLEGDENEENSETTAAEPNISDTSTYESEVSTVSTNNRRLRARSS